MSISNSFSEMVSQLKEKKVIQTYDNLKEHLSNNLLIFIEFDLPKEFNFVKISKIMNNYRFLKNFSKTISFTKSYDLLKNNLIEYFNYKKPLIPQKDHKINQNLVSKPIIFKQVIFDEDKGSNLVVDDITNINLETISKINLENVISDYEKVAKTTALNQSEKIQEKILYSSKEIRNSDLVLNSQSNLSQTGQKEFDELFKIFPTSIIAEDASSIKNDENRKEDLLNETFKLLGIDLEKPSIGNIKKSLGKNIIDKKKKEGLSFDEWVVENLIWTQFLIKNLLHLDYLSLKEESHYLSIIRNYKMQKEISDELNNLYSKLRINSQSLS
jgi:hypothetical protein